MIRRLSKVLVVVLFGLPAQADVYIRDGSDSWGRRIASQWGIPGFGQSIAVVVAVGDYRNGWTSLESPSLDAEKMTKFLVEEADFDVVYTLVDEEVQLQELHKLMDETLPKIVGTQDRVLFYFSGHGTQRQIGDRTIGYLPLQDSGKTSWASMIRMSRLEEWWVSLSSAKQSLFILDACFSGLAGTQTKSDDLRRRTIGELNARGHHLIAAGTENQESYASLSRWGGSLFTTAIIDGMRGEADGPAGDVPRDGVVSLKELWDYVDKRVRFEAPPGSMNPQLASFEFSSPGEFFFLASDYTPAVSILGSGTARSKGQIEREVLSDSARTNSPPAEAATQNQDRTYWELAETCPSCLLIIDSSEAMQVQQDLLDIGLSPGIVDGIWGLNSASALAEFQTSVGLPVTGLFDAETLKMLAAERERLTEVRTAQSEIFQGGSRTQGLSNSDYQSKNDRLSDNFLSDVQQLSLSEEAIKGKWVFLGEFDRGATEWNVLTVSSQSIRKAPTIIESMLGRSVNKNEVENNFGIIFPTVCYALNMELAVFEEPVQFGGLQVALDTDNAAATGVIGKGEEIDIRNFGVFYSERSVEVWISIDPQVCF